MKIEYNKHNQQRNDMIISKTNIAATEFSEETNIIKLDRIPTIAEQNELFTDDSIILEF